MSEDLSSSSGSYGDDENGGSASEISRQSWLQRIGKSILGVPIGLLLIMVSLVVLFWNEGRAVDTARSLSEASANLVPISSNLVDPANEGKLVHTTGMLATEDAPRDAMFGVEVKGMIRLSRAVQMYLWQENIKSETRKKLGGGSETVKTATYEKKWLKKNEARDSQGFMQPEGHQNVSWPDNILDIEYDAQKVNVGAFILSPSLLKQVHGSEALLLKKEDAQKLPDDIKGAFQVHEGAFYKLRSQGKKKNQPNKDDDPQAPPKRSDPADEPWPEEPQIGDMKVSYRIVKPHEVSIIAEQAQTTFRAYQPQSAQNTIEMLVSGNKSAKEMIAEAEAANTLLTWILRLVFFVITAVGIYLLFNPLIVLADFLPILGSLTSIVLGVISMLMALILSFITIAIAWIYYRPMLGIALLVAAGLTFIGILFFVFRGSSRKKIPVEIDPRFGKRWR